MGRLDNGKGMKRWQADLSLVFITCCWGISYIMVDICIDDMATFAVNAYRFIIASMLGLIIGYKRIKANLNKRTIILSIQIGILLFLSYVCTSFGMQYTTIFNTGFFCNSTVLFTPLLSIIFFKKKPDRKTSISILLCVAGMMLLTIGNGFGVNGGTLKGDIICAGCGFFYAIDLLTTENAVSDPEVDPYTLGVIELFITGVLNTIFGLSIEGFVYPSNLKVAGFVLFLAIFCTGMAFILQPIAQKYTTASRVGIIFTLEPVFNAIGAFLILHEVLSVRGVIGSLVMVCSIVLMEVSFKKKKE